MAKSPTIPEAKIRQAIWMLKKGKTKKAVCDHVGMAYSPKRLDTLIEDFHKRIEREKQLKAKARFKKFSESEKKSMADDYLKGDGLSAIAQRNFISPQRVKKFLMELNVPLRSRGKKKAAKVEHVVQDLDIKFKVGQKVFIADTSEYAEVKEVFKSPKFGLVAGCMVVEGLVKREKHVRVLRDNVVIHEGELDSLRRFKDDVKEVKNGTECGIGIKNYLDIKIGDVIENFEQKEEKRSL